MSRCFLMFYLPGPLSCPGSNSLLSSILSKGVSTGISAEDRSITARLLADMNTKPTDIVRPGHIFPLRSREGGVLTRDGHTEASVDLARLAGRSPCGVICEIVSEENPTGMARLPELVRFGKKHGYVLTSIADLIQYRKDTETQPTSSSSQQGQEQEQEQQ